MQPYESFGNVHSASSISTTATSWTRLISLSTAGWLKERTLQTTEASSSPTEYVLSCVDIKPSSLTVQQSYEMFYEVPSEILFSVQLGIHLHNRLGLFILIIFLWFIRVDLLGPCRINIIILAFPSDQHCFFFNELVLFRCSVHILNAGPRVISPNSSKPFIFCVVVSHLSVAGLLYLIIIHLGTFLFLVPISSLVVLFE